MTEERTLDVVVDLRNGGPRRSSARSTSIAGAVILVAAMALLRVSPVAMFFFGVLGLVAFLGGLGGLRSTPGRTPRRSSPQTVRITGEALETADGRIPLVDIAHAYVEPHADARPTVLLVDRFGIPRFEAEVDTIGQGDDFLRALGRTAQPQRQTFETRVPASAADGYPLLAIVLNFFVGAAVDNALLWLGVGPGASLLFAAIAFFASIALVLRPIRVDVGADGLARRRLGRTRFVRWSDVTKVEYVKRDVLEIAVRGKRPLRIPDPQGKGRSPNQSSLRGPIVDAWQAYRLRTGSAATVPERLGRGGRAVAEWRKAVETVRNASGDYRQVATPDEDLWRIVEDAGAPEDARAAAAIALRTAEDAPARLRVAAEAVASPRLRVALETAADREAEDAAIDEALAQLAARP